MADPAVAAAMAAARALLSPEIPPRSWPRTRI